MSAVNGSRQMWPSNALPSRAPGTIASNLSLPNQPSSGSSQPAATNLVS